jgi:hypothetical protein
MSNLVCCYFKTRARLLFKSLPNSIETLTMQRRWLKNWVWMVVWHVCLYCCPHECVAGDQQKSVWSTLCTVLEDQSGSKEVVWTWVLLLCEPLVLAGGCEVGCEPLVMWSWAGCYGTCVKSIISNGWFQGAKYSRCVRCAVKQISEAKGVVGFVKYYKLHATCVVMVTESNRHFFGQITSLRLVRLSLCYLLCHFLLVLFVPSSFVSALSLCSMYAFCWCAGIPESTMNACTGGGGTSVY